LDPDVGISRAVSACPVVFHIALDRLLGEVGLVGLDFLRT